MIDFNAEISTGYTFMSHVTSKLKAVIIENSTGNIIYMNRGPGYYACVKKGKKHDNCTVTYVVSSKEDLLAKYTTGIFDEDIAVNFQLEFGVDIWESKQKRGKTETHMRRRPE